MAYVPANLSLAVAAGPAGQQIWTLKGTDVHTDVDAADFISDGAARGMRVSDILHYVKTSATIGATTHSVQTVTAGGAATLSPAILA